MKFFSALKSRTGRLVAAVALGFSALAPAMAATVTITVRDNSYSPAAVTAQVGDTVVFNYLGNAAHPTASDNNSWGVFRLDAARPTHQLVLTPTVTTIYAYHCNLHGAAGGVGMAGTITVQAPTAAPRELARPELMAYPNPASAARQGEVTISFNPRAVAAAPDARVRLLNVIGRVVRETPLRRGAEDARVTFNVADLPAGVYFYSLHDGARLLETRRLVVQP